MLFVSSTDGGVPSGKMEHLACFLAGLFALGVEEMDGEEERELHVWAAEGLGRTCWLMYRDQPRGVGPEVAMMQSSGGGGGSGRYRRWMDVVQVWKMNGRKGRPPGVGQAGDDDVDNDKGGGREKGKILDYSIMDPSYHLRPEVRLSLFLGF